MPGLPSGIERGQWLTFTGEGDPVRNYVIRQVIVIREPGAPLADGLARSAAGFTGLELLSNPNHRPVLWGRVESVTPGATEGGADVTLSGPDGPITVQLLAGVALFFLEPYDAPITGGDRIATRAPAAAPAPPALTPSSSPPRAPASRARAWRRRSGSTPPAVRASLGRSQREAQPIDVMNA